MMTATTMKTMLLSFMILCITSVTNYNVNAQLNDTYSPTSFSSSTMAPVSKAPATKAPITITTKAPVSKAPTATTTKAPTKADTTNKPTIMPVKVTTRAPIASEVPSTTTPTISADTEMPTKSIIPNKPTAIPVSKTTAPTMVPSASLPTMTPTGYLPTTVPLPMVPVPVVVTRVPTRTPIRRRPRARIANLTLYDTTTNPATPIRNLDQQGTVFDLAMIGTNLTIAASVESDFDDVYIKYKFDDSFTSVGKTPYFTLNSNSGAKFHTFRPLTRVGTHTIVASLFNGDTDSRLDTETFDITIIDSSNNFTGPFIGFNLIDVSTQTQRPFPSIIDLDDLGTALSLNAETGSSDDDDDVIDRVMFYFDDRLVRVERSEPWTLGANTRSYFQPTPLLTVSGLHTVVAVALSSDEDVLGSSSVTFRVIDSTSTQPPTLLPVAAPVGRTEKPSSTPTPTGTTLDPTAEPSLSMGPSSTGVPSLSDVPSQTTVPSMVKQTFMPSEIESSIPSSSRVPSNFDTVEPTIEPPDE